MVNQINIVASNVAQLIALGYTHAEVWISDDYGNSYAETTASSASAAKLTSAPASTSYMIGGCTLKFKVNNGSEISVPFSSTLTFWTPTQVVSQINTIAAGRASLSADNLSVVLTSSTSGRASTLEITYCDCAQLGFSTGLKSNGLDARIALSGGTLIYTYVDQGGLDRSKYKYRYSANGSAPISNYSAPVLPSSAPAIGATNISIATALFSDVSGNAAQRTVIVAATDTPQSLFGYTVGNQLPLTFTADETGFLQIPMVKGSTVRVAIDGTSLVREFVVPNTATFDLLAVLGSATDPFTVQTTPPLLTRRSV